MYLDSSLATGRALNGTLRTVAIQFCQPDYISQHIFGFFATSIKVLPLSSKLFSLGVVYLARYTRRHNQLPS